MEKCFPSDLPGIKAYDIRLHIVATNECQEMASKFDQMLRKVLWGWCMFMMNRSKIFKSISNGLISISKMNIQFHFLSFRSSKMHMNLSMQRFNQKNSFQRKTFKSMENFRGKILPMGYFSMFFSRKTFFNFHFLKPSFAKFWWGKILLL